MLCIKTIFEIYNRFVCGYNSALWRPFATRLKQRHLDLCREQQSHHHTGERERTILRVQPERRGPGQQGPRCAKCRDAQEGTDDKSSKITKHLFFPRTGCECIF